MQYLRSYLYQAGFLPSVALVVISYALLRGVRDSMWRVALLALPGTFAHELAHLIVGFVLRAKPRGFSVWPRPSGHTWRLGSVSFRNIGLLNGAWSRSLPCCSYPSLGCASSTFCYRYGLTVSGDGGYWRAT